MTKNLAMLAAVLQIVDSLDFRNEPRAVWPKAKPPKPSPKKRAKVKAARRQRRKGT